MVIGWLKQLNQRQQRWGHIERHGVEKKKTSFVKNQVVRVDRMGDFFASELCRDLVMYSLLSFVWIPVIWVFETLKGQV